MTEFLMPSLGADMEEGTLVEWLVAPGAKVSYGDIVAVVETQKGAIEIEIFQDGEIARFLIEPGMTVPVGTPLAEIVASGKMAAPKQEPPPMQVVKLPPVTSTQASAMAAVPQAGQRVRATPAARKLAAERGISLETMHCTGIGGAVQSADVLAADALADDSAADAKPAAVPNLVEMRKAIAAAMSRSKREIPHYYLSHSFDVSAAVEWLEEQNAARAPADRLLLAGLYLKAVALALREFPAFNGFFDESGFEPARGIHVGMAINIRGGGLVAPAIHDTDEQSLNDLMAKMRDLTNRVRAGRIRGSELTDPTVTLSSLGDRGVRELFGVIFPPQVAILGVGRIEERPWKIDDDGLGLRPVLTVTLSGDHRANDGHAGALLLRKIERWLNQPEAL